MFVFLAIHRSYCAVTVKQMSETTYENATLCCAPTHHGSGALQPFNGLVCDIQLPIAGQANWGDVCSHMPIRGKMDVCVSDHSITAGACPYHPPKVITIQALDHLMGLTTHPRVTILQVIDHLLDPTILPKVITIQALDHLMGLTTHPRVTILQVIDHLLGPPNLPVLTAIPVFHRRRVQTPPQQVAMHLMLLPR